MEGHLLEVGRLYAFREKRGREQPMLKVKLLDKVGRKGNVKIRFEDGPHPGLEEYVTTRQIVVPWGQRKAVLRDEESEERLNQHRRGYRDPALGEAASAVLESSGERGALADDGGTAMDERELQRIMDRAGLDGSPVELQSARLSRPPRPPRSDERSRSSPQAVGAPRAAKACARVTVPDHRLRLGGGTPPRGRPSRRRWNYAYSMFAFSLLGFVDVAALRLLRPLDSFSEAAQGGIAGAAMLVVLVVAAVHVPPVLQVKRRRAERWVLTAAAVVVGVGSGGFFAIDLTYPRNGLPLIGFVSWGFLLVTACGTTVWFSGLAPETRLGLFRWNRRRRLARRR